MARRYFLHLYLTPALLLAAVAPAVAAEPVSIETLATAGDVLRLRLDPGFAASWRDVNVGRLVVRTTAVQHRLDETRFADLDHLDVSVPRLGCALVLLDLGPPSTRGFSDSWQRISHAAKVVTCTPAGDAASRLEARIEAGGMVMSKTGSRIEIQPLAAVTMLQPGSDLPVRVYRDGAAQIGVELEVIAPDGALRTLTTDRVGAATVRIDHSGRWHLRFTHPRPDADDLVASLTFDVEPASFWQTLNEEG